MRRISEDREPSALQLNVSVETVFGQQRYLENLTKLLYSKNIRFASDVVALRETDFLKLAGRITRRNMSRVRARMQELGLSFRGG